MINDDTLTLYYYDDGLSASERLRIDSALAEDADLAARYRRLQRDLEQWSKPQNQAAPAYLVQRWHDSIDAAARSEIARTAPTKNTVHVMSFFWGAVVAASLALGIAIGVFYSGGPSGHSVEDKLVVNPPIENPAAVPASFTRGLQVHLQQSQWDIAELSSSDAEKRRFLIAQIIEQNRIFERAANLNQSDDLARVLRAFEPVLVRLASDDITPQDARALRAQLAFELGVMLTKLSQNSSKEQHSI